MTNLTSSSPPHSHCLQLHPHKRKEMSISPNYTFTLLLLLLISTPRSSSINITSLLSPFPDLTDFNALLTSSSVAQDLLHRSSLTLLALPNSFLRSSPLLRHRPPSAIADVLRYHVLLQYFSLPDLLRFPPSGKLVTTLYQTTGRPDANLGAVNISSLNSTVLVRTPVAYSSLNTTVLSQIKTLPYNVSILTVNSLLLPSGFDLTTSSQVVPPPPRLDLARVLLEANNFNIATTLLTASNVTRELEADEAGAGITMFVPTDDAFFDFPEGEGFKSLSAHMKTTVLRFHVLHSYYPLGSLESIVNPLQPTVATEEIGAGRFTLNITRVNGSVAIDTGIVQASITRTVFDQNPVAIFAVSKVLLPREIFGKEALGTNRISCDCDAPLPGVFTP